MKLRNITKALCALMAIAAVIITANAKDLIHFYNPTTGEWLHKFVNTLNFSKTDAEGVEHAGYVTYLIQDFEGESSTLSMEEYPEFYYESDDPYLFLEDTGIAVLESVNWEFSIPFFSNLSTLSVSCRDNAIEYYEISPGAENSKYLSKKYLNIKFRENINKDEYYDITIQSSDGKLSVTKSVYPLAKYPIQFEGGCNVSDEIICFNALNAGSVSLYFQYELDGEPILENIDNGSCEFFSLEKVSDTQYNLVYDGTADPVYHNGGWDNLTLTYKLKGVDKTIVWGSDGLFQANWVVNPETALSNEEIREALMALYNGLDEDSKERMTNFNTDAPLWQWFGVAGLPEVANIILMSTDIIGTLSPGVEKLFEQFGCGQYGSIHFTLTGNSFRGLIPDEMLNHPSWNNPEFGWKIVMQHAVWAYDRGLSEFGFENEDLNLQLPEDIECDLLDGNKTTILTELAKNKLTLVCHQSGINNARINQWLSYKDKGYGLIVTEGDLFESEDEYLRIPEECPEGIVYLNNLTNTVYNLYGWDAYLGYWNWGDLRFLDSEGRLVKAIPTNSDVPAEWFDTYLDNFLQKQFGDPIEHEKFVHGYTSTDYSHDGEVITVQEASVGNGVDLVFMGDQFDDRDMDEGGNYESMMLEGIECFFGDSWVNSLRDRFNIYIVKVVSPNNSSVEDGVFRINNDESICFEYASKIPNIDLDHATIVNIHNNHNLYFVEGYANMYESGASVCHIILGGPTDIIVHESIGHGLAKLVDEYLFGTGGEMNELDEAWIQEVKAKGWYANIDTTNDPEQISWSNFLNDSRYQDEVGIYEGAWYWEFGAYRPSYQSTMNNNTSYTNKFNAPSREAIYKTIMQWSEGDDWQYDFEDFVTWDEAIKETGVIPTAAPAKTESKAKMMRGGSATTPEVKHLPGKIIKTSPTDILRGIPIDSLNRPF